MYRRETQEVHSMSAGRFEEDIVVVFRADRTPIETWLVVSGHHKTRAMGALTFRRPFLKVILQPFSCPPLAISSS